MRIGIENISNQQQELLLGVKRGHGIAELVSAFERLMNDAEIQKQQEDVHPDWAEIFESAKDSLRRRLPPRRFDRYSTFFAELLPYDRTLEALDPEKLRISFLLGAGASKPEPSSIPTVKELLPKLLERGRRLDRDDVTKLADFCDERDIDNIEDLLTAAQLATFCSRNPTVLRLLNYLLYRRDPESVEEDFISEERRRMYPAHIHRSAAPPADLSSVAFLHDTLQVLFGLLASTMLPAKPNRAHESIAKFSKAHVESSSITTTNYDCCIDMALEELQQQFFYGIDFSNRKAVPAEPKASTCLVKLHGSLNWYYCETCQEVQLVDLRSMLTQYAEDRAPYPVIGICKDCGGQRRGLLVPPLAMKFDVAPPLTPLLDLARNNFENADIICVVGFSFAEADIYISRMLSKSMQTKPDQRLLIVDPDSKVVSRVRRKFKASIPNFEPGRIIRMSGDCAQMLPRFLEGEFRAVPGGEGSRRKKPIGAPDKSRPA